MVGRVRCVKKRELRLGNNKKSLTLPLPLISFSLVRESFRSTPLSHSPLLVLETPSFLFYISLFAIISYQHIFYSSLSSHFFFPFYRFLPLHPSLPFLFLRLLYSFLSVFSFLSFRISSVFIFGWRSSFKTPLIIWSGSMTFPLTFDIFCPFSSRTIACKNT